MTPPAPPPLFAKLLAADPPPTLAVLSGEAAALSGRFAELLVETLRGRGTSAEAHLLTPLDTEKGLPVEGWRTADFFVRHRVYVLPEAQELRKEAKEDLAGWAASPADGVTVVAPALRRDGHGTLRSLPGVATVVPKGSGEVADALARGAVRDAERAGVELDPAGAAFLVEWVGLDAEKVREEVEKVVLFAGKGGRAGEEQVRQVCVARGGADPFRVARAILDGNRDAFLAAFRRYAAQAATEDYHSLAGAVAWEFRARAKRGRAALPPAVGDRVARALWEIDRGMKGESGLTPGQYLEIRLLAALR